MPIALQENRDDDKVHGIQEFIVGGAGKGAVHISDINQFRVTKDALHYVLHPQGIWEPRVRVEICQDRRYQRSRPAE